MADLGRGSQTRAVPSGVVARFVGIQGYQVLRMHEHGFLNDLILLYVHKDVPLDYDLVLDSYANDHPRRMLLSRPLVAE